MYKRGTVVLVPFPFTDLSAQKVRPALIISDAKYNRQDVVVLFVSSVVDRKIAVDEVIMQSKDSQFEQTGLKKTSLIKCRKIATLDKRIILGELGNLPTKIMQEVESKLKQVLAIR